MLVRRQSRSERVRSAHSLVDTPCDSPWRGRESVEGLVYKPEGKHWLVKPINTANVSDNNDVGKVIEFAAVGFFAK